MKIRTDFVTNSSSSNFVTISIKSPKLTEIIRAARVGKETVETDMFPWEEGDIHEFDLDESEHIVKLHLTISYNIRYDEDLDQTGEADPDYIGYPPENVSGLSKSLLRLLKEAKKYVPYQQGYDLAKICSALEEKGEDIFSDTENADWVYEMEGYGEANLYPWFLAFSNHIAKKRHLDYRPSSAELISSFHYDRENGASLKEEYGYSRPYKADPADDDLDIEMDFEDDLKSQD